jgi:hypothetical protein
MPLTNGSGSRSRRPKNIRWIRILIRNTALWSFCHLRRVPKFLHFASPKKLPVSGSTEQLQVSNGAEQPGREDSQRPDAVPHLPLDPLRLHLGPAGPH